MLSKEAWNYYKNCLYRQTITPLWKPHVSIYLNRSVDNCMKKLDPNSRVYSKDLLAIVEKNYKKSYLDAYEEKLNILKFDANEPINFEDVLSGLEGVNLEDERRNKDWQIRRETDINFYRARYAFFLLFEKFNFEFKYLEAK
jgi:hypothetical protein